MKLHTLKIQPGFYNAVLNGIKTFELRKNDRNFLEHDLIHFVNVCGEDFINEPNNLYQITYILKDVEEYGLDKDYCILGIKKLEANQKNERNFV